MEKRPEGFCYDVVAGIEEPSEKQKVEALALIHNGLGKAELENVGGYASPIYWTIRGRDGSEVMKNGSMFILDTGERVFGVTAMHVVDQYFNDTKKPAFLRFCIGVDGRPPLEIHLGDRIIDGNHEIDIATFTLNEKEIEYMNRTVLRGFNMKWPPTLAQRDAPLSYAGFPSKGRRWTAPKEFSFGLAAMGGIVSSVHEKGISLLVARQELVSLIGGEMPENFDFGGMSGGPAIAIYQSYTMRGWFPAGVVIEGPNPGDDPSQMWIPDFEVVKLRPIHFIKADGHLDIDRWDAL